MPGLTEWPQPTRSGACSDEETEAQAGEGMCPMVPAGKAFDPRCRAGVRVRGPALALMLCCCHLEIRSNFGTRRSRFSFGKLWSQSCPDLTYSKSATLNAHQQAARPRVVFQIINTVFSVGLKFWGENEALLWGRIIQGCICLSVAPIRMRAGRCQGQEPQLIHCYILRA